MSKAHINSNISLKHTPVAIDNNTILMCHFDTTTESSNGIEPTTDTVSLTGLSQRVKVVGTSVVTDYDGKYGGAALLNESTTNLFNNTDEVFGVRAGKEFQIIEYDNNTVIYRNNFTGELFNFKGWDIPVTAGITYTVSLDVYVSNDYNGTYNRFANVESLGIVTFTYDLARRETWQSYTHIFTPASSGNSRVLMYPCPNNTSGTAGFVLYRNVQVEAKSYKTPFTRTSRTGGTLRYPINISGDFTVSFWCKFDTEWYKSINNYNKILIQMLDSSGRRIDYTDYAATVNQVNSSPFFDLEPNSAWDNQQNHWHQNFGYRLNTWYMINFVKQGSTMRQIFYDNTGQVLSRTWTYSHSDKLSSFVFNELVLHHQWSAMIDELRVDNVARTDTEILSWYVSQCPFYAPDRYKMVR